MWASSWLSPIAGVGPGCRSPSPHAYPALLSVLWARAPFVPRKGQEDVLLPLDVHGHDDVGEAGVAGVAEDGGAGWGGYGEDELFGAGCSVAVGLDGVG